MYTLSCALNSAKSHSICMGTVFGAPAHVGVSWQSSAMLSIACAASPAQPRSVSILTENADHSADLEELGLDVITDLIRSRKSASITSQTCIKEIEEGDPIKIFQNSWGWQMTEDCSYEQTEVGNEMQDSRAFPIQGRGGSDDLSRKMRISDSGIVRELASSILRNGWNTTTQQEVSAKFRELRPFHVCQIIKKVQDPDLSFKIFEWARQQSGYKHTTRSYNALAGILACSKRFGAWKQLQYNMDTDGCAPDQVTFCTLIRGYSKVHQPHIVLQLYNRMRELQWEPGVVTYSCIIDVLAKHGYTDKAREVFFDMRTNGCYLDKTGYNILINLFGRKKNLHMATLLYKEMLERGLQPDGYTYTALIQTYLKIGDVSRAYKLFSELLDKKFSVSLSTCNSLIYSLGKTGKIDLAFKVFHLVEELGLQPDIHTFNTFVVVLGQLGRIGDVHGLVKDMDIRGLFEKGMSYSKAVEWLSQAGSIEAACQLLLDITTTEGTTITVANATLVDSLVKLGAVDRACMFLKEIAATGHETDIPKLNNIVKTLGEAGDVDGAFKIFYLIGDLGYRPDHASWCSIILCLSNFGSFRQACNIFEDMISSGLTPDADLYNHFISSFCKVGDMKAALDVFHRMSYGGCAPNLATFKLLLAGFARVGDWTMAFKLSKDMEDSGLIADCDVYLPLILSLGNEGRTENALQLCSHMLDRGLKPSLQTCHRLLDFLSNIRSKDGVSAIFSKLKAMSEFTEVPDHDSYNQSKTTSSKQFCQL